MLMSKPCEFILCVYLFARCMSVNLQLHNRFLNYKNKFSDEFETKKKEKFMRIIF